MKGNVCLASPPNPAALQQPRFHGDPAGEYRPRPHSVIGMGGGIPVVDSGESSVITPLPLQLSLA